MPWRPFSEAAEKRAQKFGGPIRGSYNRVMKNTGRKTVKGGKTSAPLVAKATSSGSATAPLARQAPTQDDIARRSYEIFLERGGEHGHDVEHWVQAERDLGILT